MGSVPNESCVLLVFRFTNVLSRLDYQVVCFLVNVFDFTVKYSQIQLRDRFFNLWLHPPPPSAKNTDIWIYVILAHVRLPLVRVPAKFEVHRANRAISSVRATSLAQSLVTTKEVGNWYAGDRRDLRSVANVGVIKDSASSTLHFWI